MVVATSQLRKYFKTQLLQTIWWITIQVRFKPNLTSYKAQLKKFYVANVINVFFFKYYKNYNNRMFIVEVVMNMTYGCHIKPVTIF